jgi:hypothetical protein
LLKPLGFAAALGESISDRFAQYLLYFVEGAVGAATFPNRATIRFHELILGKLEETVMSNGTKFKDIIVAVHGIGAQSRYSTVRSVATRLAASVALRPAGQRSPIATQPLGYFHSDVKSIASVRLLDDAECLEATDLRSIGFAEVFWADIPQEVVKEGRTLEETKAWARTVVARANSLCDRAQASGRNEIVPPDFSLAGEVLDEVIETVYVLENLFFLLGKAGLFKFDLRQVLEEYLGDVQLVAEFSYYRTDIVGRFHRAMESIYEEQCKLDNADVRIHIVAHSEGTVVTFLGLLHAMSRQHIIPANPPQQIEAKMEVRDKFPDWLKQVRGYMTIGSPIDKHLLLWPRLWEKLEPKLANGLFRKDRIRWRNYYDHGDPVGFKLDSARLWLAHTQCEAFQFCGCSKCKHDIGFARYLLPGEAHNQYWNDPEVFEHFISEVVKPKPQSERLQPPADKKCIPWLSPLLPYLLSFLVLAIGVFVFYKAVHHYTHPNYDPLQRFVRFTQLGVKPAAGLSYSDMLRAVIGASALIAGATLLARFPRLAIGPTWRNAGIAAFLVGCVLYVAIVPREAQSEIGVAFESLGPIGATLGVLVVAAVAGISGYLATSGKFENQDRQQRWLFRGMRPLILCGALAVLLIVIFQLAPQNAGRQADLTPLERSSLSPDQHRIIREARLTRDELNQVITARGTNWIATLAKVEPVLATHPPAWPVVVAGAVYLYLWWLATLIFDLAFIWQRYVRGSVTNDRLREWNSYGFSPRWEGQAGEPCCNPEALSATASN